MRGTDSSVRLILAGLLLILAGTASACIGDPAIQVYYHNETGQAISIYPHGRNYPSSRQILAAGEEQRNSLMFSSRKPDAVVARIEAVDATGTLIYCHRFTFGELERLGGVIRIRVGDNTC
jgi:hypothetical protein